MTFDRGRPQYDTTVSASSQLFPRDGGVDALNLHRWERFVGQAGLMKGIRLSFDTDGVIEFRLVRTAREIGVK